MNENEIKHIDLILAILQKIAILCGLFFSAWFFLLKEEGSPHVILDMEHVFMPNCIVRVDLDIKNEGGKVWDFDSSYAKVFLPTMKKIRDLKTKEEVVGSQIVNIKHSLRIGETASVGFNIPINANKKSEFYVVKAGITIKEESGQWLRIVEGAIKHDGC